MSETTPPPQDSPARVPHPREEELGLPPAVIASDLDGDGDIAAQLEEAYWSIYDGAAAQATVRQILARLPQIMRQVGRLAWQVSPWATCLTVMLQLASAAMQAFGLIATVGVAREMFAQAPTPDRVRAAVPQLLIVVALLSVRAVLEYGVSITQAHLTPRIRTALETEFLHLTSHVRLEVVDNADWHDDAYRGRDRGLFYARQIVAQVISLASAVLGLVGTAGVLTVLHPVLLLLMPLSVVPVGIAAVRSARARFHSYQRWNALQRRVNVFSWLLLDRDAAAELRSDTAQRPLLEEHHRLTQKIADEDTRLSLSSARLSLFGRAAGGVGTAITYVVLGWMLIRGWVPLATGAGAVLAIQSGHGAMTRVVDVAHLVYEHAMWVDDLLKFQQRCRDLLPRRTGQPAPDGVEEITLHNVSYTYPGKDAPALDGVTMTLRAGTTVALVGANGSGKSTCSKLLAGLYDPSEGSICWDGVDVRELDGESLQRQVGMVLQEPVRFPFSALANLTISRGTLTEAEPAQALAAARASGADQVIAELPSRWQALLSKRFRDGQELSAGQWAKIAVGRGIYKDAPVLLLDEPTASMDARAEHAVYQAVVRGEKRPGRITVLISHRLASVIECDQIYVFRKGKIIESGTHHELIALRGEYAEMFELQAQGYRSSPASDPAQAEVG
ncbi:ABC transporter ATP-binding protein [Streptomyces sp. NPDC050485]|uniref:ABC transporter ATP-binding protein n=1 Tax=Streptomyces sp. NPDC050485 TaxID=3365617 RepID=UPI00379B3FAF